MDKKNRAETCPGCSNCAKADLSGLLCFAPGRVNCRIRSYVRLDDARQWTLISKLLKRVKKLSDVLQGCIDELEPYENTVIPGGNRVLLERLNAAREVLSEDSA